MCIAVHVHAVFSGKNIMKSSYAGTVESKNFMIENLYKKATRNFFKNCLLLQAICNSKIHENFLQPDFVCFNALPCSG